MTRSIPVVLLGVALGLASLVVIVLAQQPQDGGLLQTQRAQATPVPHAETPQKSPGHTSATGLIEERLRLIEANHKLQEQVDTLTDTLAVIEEELAQIRTALQARQKAQEAERERWQKLMQARHEENNTLRQEVEHTRSALTEAHQAQTTLQQQLQTARAEVQQWQQRHTETVQSLHAAHHTALEQAKAEAHTAQQALHEQLQQRTQAFEQVQAQQAQTTQQLQSTEEQRAARQVELTQRQDTITQLEAALATQRATLEQREHALAQAQQALSSAQQEAQAVQLAAQQSQQQQTETAQALKTAQAALAQQQAEARTAQQALEAPKAQQAQDLARWQALHERLAQELKEPIQQQHVSIQRGTDRLTIRVGGEALFGPGAVSLRPESRNTLDKIAAALQGISDYVIRVEGHTDNIPTGGPTRDRWSTNWELSAARAASVVRYLQEKGIPPEHLAIGGYAFYRPVATNDTPEGRALNRRIEITLLPMVAVGDKEQSR